MIIAEQKMVRRHNTPERRESYGQLFRFEKPVNNKRVKKFWNKKWKETYRDDVFLRSVISGPFCALWAASRLRASEPHQVVRFMWLPWSLLHCYLTNGEHMAVVYISPVSTQLHNKLWESERRAALPPCRFIFLIMHGELLQTRERHKNEYIIRRIVSFW